MAEEKTDDPTGGIFGMGRQDSETARRKEGDAKIPKTSFKPIAAPGRLNALNKSFEEIVANKRLMYEDLMYIFISTKTVVTLWGSVGAGKTRSIEALAELTDENGVNYQVITLQPSTEDPMVVHGMMTVVYDAVDQKHIMQRSIPEPAESVWRYFNDKDGLTIMFLDEMTTCMPAQQNAMLGLLTHGKYGDQDISPYVTFVMAANPPGTVSTVIDLSEAVINRSGHIPWYSERDHWLPKWSSGFGNPAKEPPERTKNFITKLIDMDPDIVFRDDPDHYEEGEKDDMWTIDDLCPYDQMHASERALTETAKVYTIVSEVLADAEYRTRKMYVQEAVKAMIGPRWARHAGVVEDILESVITTAPSINAVNKYNINNSTGIDTIVSNVGDSLHRIRGKRMVSDQTVELAEKFEKEIFPEDGSIAVRRYISFWVWASTAPDEATRMSIVPTATNIFVKAASSNKIPRDTIMPRFVPDELKAEIKDVVSRQKRN